MSRATSALRQKNPRRRPHQIYDVCLFTKDERCIIAWGWVRARSREEAVAAATNLATSRGHEIGATRNCNRLRSDQRSEFEQLYGTPALRAAKCSQYAQETEAKGRVRNPFLGFVGFDEVTP